MHKLLLYLQYFITEFRTGSIRVAFNLQDTIDEVFSQPILRSFIVYNYNISIVSRQQVFLNFGLRFLNWNIFV